MVKQRLGKVYRGGRRHIYQRPYILPIFGLLLGVAIVFGVSLTRHGQTLKVSDYHIVYLFDKGQRQTLNTQAKTVGALLKRLPDLKLSQADVVEPAIRTKIVEDNYRVNIYRARPVTIVDGGKKRITLTAQRSARVVAQKAGLKVEPEDKVVFAQGNLANNTIGEEVVVLRATTVQLNLYGKSIRIHTHAKTVGDLLIERGIILKKEDKIRPKVKTAIRKNLQIYVLRNGKSLFTREKIIPAPVEYVTDPSLSFGAEVIRQEGAPGKRAITFQISIKDGKLRRKQIQSVVIKEAVPRIVARGSVVDVAANKEDLMKAAGINRGDFGYVNFIISHESNWNPAARNAGGCLGLGQACPGSKLTAVCSLNDPVCQLRFFSGYAEGRYGGWSGAYSFWLSSNYW